jgi:hypothetical protein
VFVQEIERLTEEVSQIRARCQEKEAHSNDHIHALSSSLQSLSDTFQRIMLRDEDAALHSVSETASVASATGSKRSSLAEHPVGLETSQDSLNASP